MNLTARERKILAHVVVDVDAWVAHAKATIGDGAIRAKIDRHAASYDAAPRTGYKNRARREAEELAARTAARDARRAQHEEYRLARESALDARITAEVTRQLDARA
eukprot:GHVR01070838.1.p2 GENE.GHVR01070838.1~~GHVR01070838.1.p2  ORF type:complete len:106 (-),score=24.12 GHVR01070838.1:493-810(-)